MLHSLGARHVASKHCIHSPTSAFPSLLSSQPPFLRSAGASSNVNTRCTHQAVDQVHIITLLYLCGRCCQRTECSCWPTCIALSPSSRPMFCFMHSSELQTRHKCMDSMAAFQGLSCCRILKVTSTGITPKLAVKNSMLTGKKPDEHWG